MRVAVFSHTFPRFKSDIPAAFMEGLATGMQEAGSEVFALVPYDKKINRKKSDQNYNFRYFKYVWPDSLSQLGYSRVLHSDQKIRPIVYLLSPLYYFFGFWALLKLVISEKIDLINAYWILPGGFIAAFVSLITGKPLVITVNGSDVYLATKNSLYRYMALFAAWRAKHVIAGGSRLWTKDLERLGVSKTKTKHVIIYGVDPKQFYPTSKGQDRLRKKFKLSKDTLVVLAVGRFVYKKGMHVLIGSVPAVVKQAGRADKRVHFVIVGDGDQRQELEKQVDDLGVRDCVSMPGFIERDELLSYYNLCDIYVSTSVRDKEGNLDDQSIALVEAQACRKLTIATDLAGNRNVVRYGVNGYLFPMGDSAALAKYINKLVGDKSLREKMANASYKMALEEFSIQAVGKAYTRLFKKLVR